jgi:hypothetical protein
MWFPSHFPLERTRSYPDFLGRNRRSTVLGVQSPNKTITLLDCFQRSNRAPPHIDVHMATFAQLIVHGLRLMASTCGLHLASHFEPSPRDLRHLCFPAKCKSLTFGWTKALWVSFDCFGPNSRDSLSAPFVGCWRLAPNSIKDHPSHLTWREHREVSWSFYSWSYNVTETG